MANRQLPHQRNLPPHATPYTSWLGAAKEPWLAQPFKSGLTPITYSDSLSDLDPEKYWYNQRCEAYQKQQFYQFTSQHFIDLRSTNHFGDSVSPSTLTLIHPIFKRSNWIDSTSNVKPLHYLPRGWTGAWSGQNDVVWDLLQPVLALATQFLENSDAWDWWDALHNGPRRDIPAEQHQHDHQGPPFQSFHRRSRAEIVAHPGTTDRAWQRKLEDGVIFRLGESRTDAWGNPQPFMGSTLYSYFHNKVVIYLGFQMIAPLLDPDLALDQQLMCQLHTAMMVLHELAHASNLLLEVERQGISPHNASVPREPFFEDERAAELGSSLVTALIGGELNGATTIRKTYFIDFLCVAPFAMLLEPWPAERRFNEAYLRGPGVPGMIDINFLPVQTEMISALQDQNYWDHAIKIIGPPLTQVHKFIHSRIDTARFGWGINVIDPIHPALEFPGQHENPMFKPWLNLRQHVRDILVAAYNDGEMKKRIQEEAVEHARQNNSMALDKDKWSDAARIAYEGIAKIKYGATPHVFLDLPDQVRFMQSEDISDTRRNQRIHRFMRLHNNALAVDEMREFIPFQLFSSYIFQHGRKIGDNQVSTWRHEDLRMYFRWCNKNQTRFDYSYIANGYVRKRLIDQWPLDPVMELTNASQRMTDLVDTIEEIFNTCPWRVWSHRGNNLTDADADRAIHFILEALRVNYNVTNYRERDIKAAFRLMSDANFMIFYGPLEEFGVIRRLSTWGYSIPADAPDDADPPFTPFMPLDFLDPDHRDPDVAMTDAHDGGTPGVDDYNSDLKSSEGGNANDAGDGGLDDAAANGGHNDDDTGNGGHDDGAGDVGNDDAAGDAGGHHDDDPGDDDDDEDDDIHMIL